MAIYVIAMTNLAYLGVMGWFLYDGLRVGLFGGGYRLLGGRESFGGGARVAGFIMALPLPASILTWVIILTGGNVSMEEIRRGDHNALALAATAVVIVLCFGVSYVVAEVTNTPYWLYKQKRERAAVEVEDENLDEEEQRRRKKKLEKKLEKARQRDEEKRRMLEAEEERLKRRHDQSSTSKRPPPIRDDDERGGRR